MAASRRNQRVTLLMLVLASITALTLDYHGEASHAINHLRNGIGDVLSPVQRAVAATLHPIGDVVSGSIHYGALQTQNERLRSEIGTLNQRLAEDNVAAESGKELLSLNGLPFVENLPSVEATVISEPTSNFEATIEIDKGTSSGVGVSMPVVANGGLIGTVTGASSSTATVLLITDHRSKVGVRDAADDLFIANGAGSGEPLSLSPISSATTQGRVGQLLETSSLDAGAFPAGLPVADVTSVRSSLGGTAQAVTARPVVNLSDLAFVSVLQWLPPA